MGIAFIVQVILLHTFSALLSQLGGQRLKLSVGSWAPLSYH